MNILSLGAGIQSSTVLLMSIKGILPKLDYAIFADTGWEPKAVYDHLSWLEEEAGMARIIVARVSNGNIKDDALVSQIHDTKNKGKRWASMPYRVLAPDGSKGMIRRQCTREYKIEPITRFIRRRILGLKKGQRVPKGIKINQWFGISADEPKRIRASKDHWIDYVYPLAGIPNDMLSKPMARYDCIDWLETNYPDRKVWRSACTGCPYKTNDEWRFLKDNSPEEWEDACAFDDAIRNMSDMRGQVFIHRSCKPLREVDLRTDNIRF